MRWIVVLSLSFVGLWGVNLNFQSFSAHFEQVVLGEGPSPVYTGEIFAKMPDYAKWVYYKPLAKEIYMRDKKVVIYEPQLLQATLTSLDTSLDFFSILKKAKLQKDGRYKTKIKGTTYYLTLQNNLPYLLEFTDKLHNKVKVTFSSVKTNIPLEDSIFVFTLPKGVDLIRH
ncbi:LolA-like outer membrane lipoprotein chaperone [Helicobacter salomonis]|uniref:LolA-like outer membrane lipoprotein chaperone n=1 Tax=Helicobacter salomonis TaxID=56878 RepID=UPI000CF166B9|nr:LolA-like outer membrane lipoprotein chaperone [Helicobacter salomonis]